MAMSVSSTLHTRGIGPDLLPPLPGRAVLFWRRRRRRSGGNVADDLEKKTRQVGQAAS